MDATSGRLPVLPSLTPAINQPRWVTLHTERLDAAVERWGDSCRPQQAWRHPCHYFDGTEATLRWIFVLDVLNFCFWPDRGQTPWTVSYDGQDYSGYWGLAASLRRALDSGFPITAPTYLAELPKADLAEIFSGRGEIPLFDQRLSNLREAGRVLLSRWRGDIVNLLEEARGSAVETVQLVAGSFDSFRDEADYHDHRVLLWKRAQLFVADVHAAFSGQGWGKFDDIDELTAFADYKLPQVLREMGILSYQPELAEIVDLMQLLTVGGEEEIEIRAITIWAVERLKKVFGSLGKAVTSASIDQWLWQLGQFDAFRNRPYHRCRTIFY